MTRSRLTAAFLGACVAACQVVVGIGRRDAVDPADAGGDAPRPPPSVDSTEGGAGVVECKLGTVACRGGCVDDRSSSDHCGACDHSCRGARCERAECAPERITSDARSGAAYVYGGELFFRRGANKERGADAEALVARSLQTGDERIALGGVRDYFGMTQLSGSAWLLFDDDAVGAGGPRIRVVDLVFGTSQVVYDDPTCPSIRNVVAKNGRLFFSTRGDLRSIRAEGGDLQILMVAPATKGVTPALFADADAVYFGVEGDHVVYAIPPGGGPPRIADRGDGPPAYIDEANGYLRWLADKELRRVPLAGGPPLVTSVIYPAPHAVSGSADHLFVASNVFAGGGGTIYRHAWASGQTLTLATSQARVGQIAVDDRYVYLPHYQEAGGGIDRVAR